MVAILGYLFELLPASVCVCVCVHMFVCVVTWGL